MRIPGPAFDRVPLRSVGGALRRDQGCPERGGLRGSDDLRLRGAEYLLGNPCGVGSPGLHGPEVRESELQGAPEGGGVRYPAGDGGLRQEFGLGCGGGGRIEEGIVRIAARSPPRAGGGAAEDGAAKRASRAGFPGPVRVLGGEIGGSGAEEDQDCIRV